MKENSALIGYDWEKVITAQTLRQLHGEYSCKVDRVANTYELFDRYLIDNEMVKTIEKPLFFLHSRDDDLTPAAFLPHERFHL